MLPLSGIRVLDLTRLAPGPYATLVLADLGADVVKLEAPGGDPTRAMPPGEGSVFAALNRGKRSLELDLKRPGAVEAVLRVLAGCDVLVEGFRPGVLDRLGLGHALLLERFPQLVVCALSGYGQDSQERFRAGHDLGYQARAGLLGLGGQGGAPAMPGGQVADIGGAWVAVGGILAALLARATTGRGQTVDVSLVEATTSFAALQLGAVLHGGAAPVRGQEPLDGGLPSYGLYRTADGRWLAVAALEPHFFRALCQRLGLPDLTGGAAGRARRLRGAGAGRGRGSGRCPPPRPGALPRPRRPGHAAALRVSLRTASAGAWRARPRGAERGRPLAGGDLRPRNPLTPAPGLRPLPVWH